MIDYTGVCCLLKCVKKEDEQSARILDSVGFFQQLYGNVHLHSQFNELNKLPSHFRS